MHLRVYFIAKLRNILNLVAILKPSPLLIPAILLWQRNVRWCGNNAYGLNYSYFLAIILSIPMGWGSCCCIFLYNLCDNCVARNFCFYIITNAETISSKFLHPKRNYDRVNFNGCTWLVFVDTVSIIYWYNWPC